MIHRAGAGPKPIPPREVSVENLTEAIKILVSDNTKTAAGTMAEQIKKEVSSFINVSLEN